MKKYLSIVLFVGVVLGENGNDFLESCGRIRKEI